MAKRRTKKQKIKAKAQRVKMEVKIRPEIVEKKSKKIKKVDGIDAEGVTQKKLIIRDLVKTGLVSLVLLGLLIGVYFYLS